MKSTRDIIRKARELGLGIPAFNVAHIPMTEPIIRAVRDQDSFALVEVSRIDWVKFGAKSPAAVAAEYKRHDDPRHVRLHLDHVPVIDEDQKKVDYRADHRGIDLTGLPLRHDRRVPSLAGGQHPGHAGDRRDRAPRGHPRRSGAGRRARPRGRARCRRTRSCSTRGRASRAPRRRQRFAKESGCDWLSVAIGNIHGAVGEATKDQKKVEAHLALDHLSKLAAITGLPLVLHGGSGIRQADMLASMKRGIAKVNVGTEIRQAYEQALKSGGTREGRGGGGVCPHLVPDQGLVQAHGIRASLMD